MSNKSKKAILLAGICTGSLLWGESTNAQTCTPAPDCESLGYNQSSCPGGFLRCPFDASKLSCMPDCNLSITAEQCASECREVGSLSCVKDGVTYYSECGESLCKGTEQCEKGSTNADGALEPGLCVPGGLGGILYSDMTVSNEIVSGKTAIGVIVSGSGDGRQRAALSLFARDWDNLPEIKLHLKGTDFQLKVWQALLRIPPGGLVTYGDIAADMGRPTACRAVGTAVGDNPVAYLIPCHRVIRATGEWGPYRWGETRKTALIGWEAARREREPFG